MSQVSENMLKCSITSRPSFIFIRVAFWLSGWLRTLPIGCPDQYATSGPAHYRPGWEWLFYREGFTSVWQGIHYITGRIEWPLSQPSFFQYASCIPLSAHYIFLLIKKFFHQRYKHLVRKSCFHIACVCVLSTSQGRQARQADYPACLPIICITL